VKTTANNAHCPPHHWLLPRPDGPTCEGICKFCGAYKTFLNSYMWHHEWQVGGAAKLPPIVLKRAPL